MLRRSSSSFSKNNAIPEQTEAADVTHKLGAEPILAQPTSTRATTPATPGPLLSNRVESGRCPYHRKVGVSSTEHTALLA